MGGITHRDSFVNRIAPACYSGSCNDLPGNTCVPSVLLHYLCVVFAGSCLTLVVPRSCIRIRNVRLVDGCSIVSSGGTLPAEAEAKKKLIITIDK